MANPKDKWRNNWGYGGVIRRDFRSDKSGPETIIPRRKKNKKWCKNKEGKEHKFFPYKHSYFWGAWSILFKCSSCGKERYESYESWPKEIPLPGLWNRYWPNR